MVAETHRATPRCFGGGRLQNLRAPAGSTAPGWEERSESDSANQRGHRRERDSCMRRVSVLGSIQNTSFPKSVSDWTQRAATPPKSLFTTSLTFSFSGMLPRLKFLKTGAVPGITLPLSSSQSFFGPLRRHAGSCRPRFRAAIAPSIPKLRNNFLRLQSLCPKLASSPSCEKPVQR